MSTQNPVVKESLTTRDRPAGDSLNGMVRHIVDATELSDELLEMAESMKTDGFLEEHDLLSDAARSIIAFRDELNDWHNAALHVESEHPDEVHCGCVPILRKKNAELLAAISAFCEGQKWAAEAWKSQPHIKPIFDLSNASREESLADTNQPKGK